MPGSRVSKHPVPDGSGSFYVEGGEDVAVEDGGTGASTHTDNAVLFGAGTGAIEAVGPGTNGQLLIGATGANAAFQTLSGAATLSSAGVLTAVWPHHRQWGADVIGQSFPRHFAESTATSMFTDQQMHLCPVVLYAGTTAAYVSFATGGTGVGTPVNWWFALYDSSLNLMAQTADQTTAAWPANTITTLALSTPQAILTTGVYFVGGMVNHSVAPAIITKITGPDASTPLYVGLGNGRYDTGLTTTAPSTATLALEIRVFPWCEVLGP